MEGRKESKYNLTGICPECGKTIKVEHIISVDLVEQTTSKNVEAKGDGQQDSAKGTGSGAAESGSVRPSGKTGPTGTTSATVELPDSEKGAGDKKAGGKAK